jgi:hypothetical protein
LEAAAEMVYETGAHNYWSSFDREYQVEEFVQG